MKKAGRLIIISSPSGGGKTSVIKYLLSNHANMVHSVSYTTRPMRPGQIDNGYYHFVDEKTFRDGVNAGQFAEWAEVHNHLYGTPIEPLERLLAAGKDIVLDVDVVGGMNLKALYKERAISIFLLPPSIEELERRLSERRTDSAEVRKVRLQNAIEEMKHKNKYDYRIVNDVLGETYHKIDKILGIVKSCPEERI